MDQENKDSLQETFQEKNEKKIFSRDDQGTKPVQNPENSAQPQSAELKNLKDILSQADSSAHQDTHREENRPQQNESPLANTQQAQQEAQPQASEQKPLDFHPSVQKLQAMIKRYQQQ